MAVGNSFCVDVEWVSSDDDDDEGVVDDGGGCEERGMCGAGTVGEGLVTANERFVTARRAADANSRNQATNFASRDKIR